MRFDPFWIAAMAVGALQLKSVAGRLLMFLREKHLRESVFMKITEYKRYIAHLDDSVRSHPKQAIPVARDLHARPLEQPVWNGTKRHQRLAHHFRPKLF